MTDYLVFLRTFQALLPHLSPAQAKRVGLMSNALLMAGAISLSQLARFLPRPIARDSRLRWLRRLLDARFTTQDRLYLPFLRALLPAHTPVWHVLIDRTTLSNGVTDLAMVSLSYRKRAIPLVWCRVPYGGAATATYIELLRRAYLFLPPGGQVIVHGDTEFGAREMLVALRAWGWDFIMAQPTSTHLWVAGQVRQPLSSLSVPARGHLRLGGVTLFAGEPLGGLTLVAFRQKHYNGTRCKREACYLVTSLAPSVVIRCLGRRRWGTEAMFKDYKSSGWHICASAVKPARFDSLLVFVALVYTWLTCVGRWLCKRGRRREVDVTPRRRLSLFRIGWDWLVHRLRCCLPIPDLSILYP